MNPFLTDIVKKFGGPTPDIYEFPEILFVIFFCKISDEIENEFYLQVGTSQPHYSFH